MAYLYRFCYEQVFGDEQMMQAVRNLEIEKMKTDPGIDEHMEDVSQVAAVFGTDLQNGLIGKKAAGRGRFSQERANRSRFGSNRLTPIAQQSWYMKFIIAQTAGFFPALLLAALLNVGIFFYAYNWEELFNAGMIALVMVVSGTMVFYESGKGEAFIDFYGGIEEMPVSVIRNGGKVEEIPAADLVCGDVVVKMHPGSKIAADMIILSCSTDCIVDNEVIHRDDRTHEARSTKPTSPHALLTENLCFRGTHVVKGKIHKALVIRVGDQTQIGRLLNIDGAKKKPKSPIAIEMELAQKTFIKMALLAGVFGTGCAWTVGVSFVRACAIGTAFGLAVLPSGLNMYLAICMRVALARMQRIMVMDDGMLVQEYVVKVKGVEFTEAIGATSCIVTDRSGILTAGKQEVAKVVVVDGEGSVQAYTTGAPDMAFENSYLDAMNDPEVEELHKCAVLCMDEVDTRFVEAPSEEGYESRFDEQGNQKPFKVTVYEPSIQDNVPRVQWETVGNKFEGALLKFFHDQREVPFRKGENIDYAREEFPNLFEVPFTRQNGFELKVRCAHRGSVETNNKARRVYMKGTPEQVLARCDKLRMGVASEPLDIDMREKLEDFVNQLGYSGLRVMAFAESADLKYRDYGNNYVYSMEEGKDYTANFPIGCPPAPRHADYVVNERAGQFLTFLGFICTYDPPREEVVEAVKESLDAGIRVIMCTGDHPQAATACAKALSIIPEDSETDQEIMTNNRYLNKLMADFPELQDEQLRIDHIAREHAVDKRGVDKKGFARIRDPSSANVAVVVCDNLTQFRPDEWWDEKLTQYQQLILSRCQPTHKLALVEHAQRLGHIVAVTGAHSTDVPSLKQANIGVTLGKCTSAAEDAADIIVNVNEFGALVAAIKEGRQVFENMKKIVAYCMITCWPQLLAFMAFALLRMPLPFSLPLVLLIDCVTNVVPAIGMAFEKKEVGARGGIMARDPRNTFLDRLLTGKMFFYSFFQLGMIQACAGFYAYLVVMNDYGYPPHLMIGGGDSDYWGNYPLFCQFVGGQYVNTKGEIDPSRYPGSAPPRTEFPLWDEGDSGYVKQCVFPIKNVRGIAKNPASKYMEYLNDEFLTITREGPNDKMETFKLREDGFKGSFKIGNAFSYDQNTGEGGSDMVSVEAVEALEAAGYYEYTPWKSRVSGFWNSRWLAYDIVGGVAEDYADAQIPPSPISPDDYSTAEQRFNKRSKKELVALAGGPSLDSGERCTTTRCPSKYFNKMSVGLWSVCLSDSSMSKTEGGVWYANTRQLQSVYGWNATAFSTTGCSVPGASAEGSMASAPLMRKLKANQEVGDGTGVLFTDALFCNGDHSYDRLLKKHGIYYDYEAHNPQSTGGYTLGRWKVEFSDEAGSGKLRNPLSDSEKADLKAKAEACWKVDDHPHQVKYCLDKCSYDCTKVLARDRSNTTLWEEGGVKQCYNISSRMSQREALYMARTAFAVAVIICQLFAAVGVKTRWQSVITFGMDNTYINFGIVIGCIVLAYGVYMPLMNDWIQTRPLRFTHWLPGIPWAFVIIAFDEVRKFVMRITSRVDQSTGKMQKGWAESNSMY